MSLGMCIGKAAIRCPNCHEQIEAIMPDTSRPFWSLTKPHDKKAIGEPIQHYYYCNNPSCGAKVRVYWYDKKVMLR